MDAAIIIGLFSCVFLLLLPGILVKEKRWEETVDELRDRYGDEGITKIALAIQAERAVEREPLPSERK